MNRQFDGQEIPVFFEREDAEMFSRGAVYRCLCSDGGNGTVDLYFPGRGGKVISVDRGVAKRIFRIRNKFVGVPFVTYGGFGLRGMVRALVLEEGNDGNSVAVQRIGLAIHHKVFSLYEVIFPE